MNQQLHTGNGMARIILVTVVVFVLTIVALILKLRSGSSPSIVPIRERPIEVANLPQSTPTPASELPVGVMRIKAPVQSVLGQPFKVSVSLEAPNTVLSGADMILRYDPEKVSANTEIVTGDFFANYPRKQVDAAKGIIHVTGFGARILDPIQSPQEFCMITFEGKGKGTATFSIDWATNRTNLSTIVERGSSKNILGSAPEATVTIE
jgi:hypothetical protein